ncbi:MAG: DUF2341 domain-containing protein [Methanobacteriota archaeon]
MVFAWTNNDPANCVALGDVLADYVDGGGKLVILAFAWWSDDGQYSLSGRIVTDAYGPFLSEDGHNHYSTSSLGTYDASHPLMQGVTTASDYYRDYVSLATGATLVASWDDGEEFVAVKGNIIGINSHMGSASSYGGDMGQLLHNVVNYNWPGTAAWMNSLWSRAIPVTIDNTANPELTDYQISITVPYMEGMRLDYGDVRFAEVGAIVPLPHWMEMSSPTSATFWVKVPTIPAYSTMIIWAYYYNPGATSTSNGDATFEFFDDFATADTSKFSYGQTVPGTAPYQPIFYDVANGELREWSDGTWRCLKMNKIFAPADTFAIGSRFKTSGPSTWHQNYLAQDTNVDRNRLGFYSQGGTSPPQFHYQMAYDGSYNDGNWLTLSFNTWFKNEIIKTTPTGIQLVVLNNDRSNTIGHASFGAAAWADETWTWVNWQNENVNVYHDWIYVRKAIASEPTFSVEATPIYPPGQEGGAAIQEQTVIVSPPTGHTAETVAARSSQFDLLVGITVMVAMACMAIPIIGRRMRRD